MDKFTKLKVLEYFNGDELATDVWVEKYALTNEEGIRLEETPNDMLMRIAKEFERIEKKKYGNDGLTADEIFYAFTGGGKISDGFVIPQGRPLFGIGNNFSNVTIANCFVIPQPEDSYSSILQSEERMISIMKRGGGVGCDLSSLRPSGFPVKNSAKTTSGVVSFMKRYSNGVNECAQNGRRGASMLSYDVEGIDVEKFITSKADHTSITGANISVKISDSFMDAVKENKTYKQFFKKIEKKPSNIEGFQVERDGDLTTYSREVPAVDIWNKIIENAWSWGEPGMMFWSTHKNESNSDCYGEKYSIITTNPCSEICLPANGVCLLILLNLNNFVLNPYEKGKAVFDSEIFEKMVRLTTRLADDMVDLEIEKIERIIKSIEDSPETPETKKLEIQLWRDVIQQHIDVRRVGIGITGLGDMLASLGHIYGDPLGYSVELVDQVFERLAFLTYDESHQIAKRLGTFKIYDAKVESDSETSFKIGRRLGANGLTEYIEKNGEDFSRRNVALLTCPPAGSISILTQTTSGIEPLFQKSYQRRKKVNSETKSPNSKYFEDKNGILWETFTVHHPQYKKYLEIKERVGAENVFDENIFIEANDINWENRVEIQSVAQKHIDHSISSTINLPKDTPKEVVGDIYMRAWERGLKGITVYRDGCRDGVLITNNNKDTWDSGVIKRPPLLECDGIRSKISNVEYVLLVGLLDGNPYETFLYINDKNELPSEIKNTSIKKLKRGDYRLIGESKSGEKFEVKISLGDEEGIQLANSLSRMISLSLRHGIPIDRIVEQLERMTGFNNIPRTYSRLLKKYIKNGGLVIGENCPTCGSNLTRENGCVICKQCGYSVC